MRFTYNPLSGFSRERRLLRDNEQGASEQDRKKMENLHMTEFREKSKYAYDKVQDRVNEYRGEVTTLRDQLRAVQETGLWKSKQSKSLQNAEKETGRIQKEIGVTYKTYSDDVLKEMSKGNKDIAKISQLQERLFYRVDTLEHFYTYIEKEISQVENSLIAKNVDVKPTLKQRMLDRRLKTFEDQRKATREDDQLRTIEVDWYSRPFDKMEQRAYHLLRLPGSASVSFEATINGIKTPQEGRDYEVINLSGGAKYVKFTAEFMQSLPANMDPQPFVMKITVKNPDGGPDKTYNAIPHKTKDGLNNLTFSFASEKRVTKPPPPPPPPEKKEAPQKQEQKPAEQPLQRLRQVDRKEVAVPNLTDGQEMMSLDKIRAYMEQTYVPSLNATLGGEKDSKAVAATMEKAGFKNNGDGRFVFEKDDREIVLQFREGAFAVKSVDYTYEYLEKGFIGDMKRNLARLDSVGDKPAIVTTIRNQLEFMQKRIPDNIINILVGSGCTVHGSRDNNMSAEYLMKNGKTFVMEIRDGNITQCGVTQENKEKAADSLVAYKQLFDGLRQGGDKITGAMVQGALDALAIAFPNSQELLKVLTALGVAAKLEGQRVTASLQVGSNLLLFSIENGKVTQADLQVPGEPNGKEPSAAAIIPLVALIGLPLAKVTYDKVKTLTGTRSRGIEISPTPPKAEYPKGQNMVMRQELFEIADNLKPYLKQGANADDVAQAFADYMDINNNLMLEPAEKLKALKPIEAEIKAQLRNPEQFKEVADYYEKYVTRMQGDAEVKAPPVKDAPAKAGTKPEVKNKPKTIPNISEDVRARIRSTGDPYKILGINPAELPGEKEIRIIQNKLLAGILKDPASLKQAKELIAELYEMEVAFGKDGAKLREVPRWKELKQQIKALLTDAKDIDIAEKIVKARHMVINKNPATWFDFDADTVRVSPEVWKEDVEKYRAEAEKKAKGATEKQAPTEKKPAQAEAKKPPEAKKAVPDAQKKITPNPNDARKRAMNPDVKEEVRRVVPERKMSLPTKDGKSFVLINDGYVKLEEGANDLSAGIYKVMVGKDGKLYLIDEGTGGVKAIKNAEKLKWSPVKDMMKEKLAHLLKTRPTFGWKIHLDFDPSNAEHVARVQKVCEQLKAQGKISGFKIGLNAGQLGKEATINVGARDAVEEVSRALDRELGNILRPPTQGADSLGDDIAMVVDKAGRPKVMARFDAPGDHNLLQYGSEGIPDLTKNGQKRTYQNPTPAEKAAMREENVKYLKENYGEFFEGSSGKPFTPHESVHAPGDPVPHAPTAKAPETKPQTPAAPEKMKPAPNLTEDVRARIRGSKNPYEILGLDSKKLPSIEDLGKLQNKLLKDIVKDPKDLSQMNKLIGEMYQIEVDAGKDAAKLKQVPRWKELKQQIKALLTDAKDIDIAEKIVKARHMVINKNPGLVFDALDVDQLLKPPTAPAKAPTEAAPKKAPTDAAKDAAKDTAKGTEAAEKTAKETAELGKEAANLAKAEAMKKFLELSKGLDQEKVLQLLTEHGAALGMDAKTIANFQKSNKAGGALFEAIKGGDSAGMERLLKAGQGASKMRIALNALGVGMDVFALAMTYNDWQANGGRIEAAEATGNKALANLYKDAYTMYSVEGVTTLVCGGVALVSSTVGLCLLPVTMVVMGAGHVYREVEGMRENMLKSYKDYMGLPPAEMLHKMHELLNTYSYTGKAFLWMAKGASWEDAKQTEFSHAANALTQLTRSYLMKTAEVSPSPGENQEEFQKRYELYVRDAMDYLGRQTGSRYTQASSWELPDMFRRAMAHAQLCATSRELSGAGMTHEVTWKGEDGKEYKFDLSKYHEAPPDGLNRDQLRKWHEEKEKAVRAYMGERDAEKFESVKNVVGLMNEKNKGAEADPNMSRHTFMQQMLLQEITHDLHKYDQVLQFTDFSGLDIPLISEGDTNARTLVRYATFLKLRQELRTQATVLLDKPDMTKKDFDQSVQNLRNWLHPSSGGALIRQQFAEAQKLAETNEFARAKAYSNRLLQPDYVAQNLALPQTNITQTGTKEKPAEMHSVFESPDRTIITGPDGVAHLKGMKDYQLIPIKNGVVYFNDGVRAGSDNFELHGEGSFALWKPENSPLYDNKFTAPDLVIRVVKPETAAERGKTIDNPMDINHRNPPKTLTRQYGSPLYLRMPANNYQWGRFGPNGQVEEVLTVNKTQQHSGELSINAPGEYGFWPEGHPEQHFQIHIN